MLSVSNLAEFGSAGANPGAGGEAWNVHPMVGGGDHRESDANPLKYKLMEGMGLWARGPTESLVPEDCFYGAFKKGF